MEKKKDYNYLIELFNKWASNNCHYIYQQQGTIGICEVDETYAIKMWYNIEDAIEWLEEQLQPTYEDALQFIIDNEDGYSNYFVSYNVAFNEWGIRVVDGLLRTPFMKYMTEEKCEEFIEKFKTVKPKV